MNTPIYIISLKDNDSRRKLCLETLKKAHVEDKFINIFDAKTYSDVNKEYLLDDYTKGVDLKLSFNRKIHVSGELTKNEIGCAFSYISIYQHIVDNNIEKAMIFEDDAVIPETFLTRLEDCEALPVEKYDVINFGCYAGVRSPIYPINPRITFKNKEYYLHLVGWGSKLIDSLFSRRRVIFSAHCYLITKAGCKKLLDVTQTNLYSKEKYKNLKIQLPADYLLGYIALNGLKTYEFNDSGFVGTSGAPSHIGDRLPHKIE